MIPYEPPPAAPRLGTSLKVLGIVQIEIGPPSAAHRRKTT